MQSKCRLSIPKTYYFRPVSSALALFKGLCLQLHMPYLQQAVDGTLSLSMSGRKLFMEQDVIALVLKTQGV